ncbi:MAG: RidA family protein [Deltaproteobacteria bacterium]|nr:RidA family protein [Deltaproteobacteria bacterium]
MIRFITDAPDAPKAIGPYSQAAVTNGLAFISGQVPIDPATGNLVSGGIEEQTTQVMKNLAAILKHLNIDFSHVASSRIYLTDLGHFQTVNAIYEKALGGHRPARATIQVGALPKAAQVEIEMVAAMDK